MSSDQPLCLLVPPNAAPEQTASFPNPTHPSVDASMGMLYALSDSERLTDEEQCAVLMVCRLAEAYVHLTTYPLGATRCLRMLRGIWQARRSLMKPTSA